MSGQQMNREKLEKVVPEITKRLSELCANPGEVLTVLIHTSATALWFVVSNMDKKAAREYVVSFCMQITKLIDANIKANENP